MTGFPVIRVDRGLDVHGRFVVDQTFHGPGVSVLELRFRHPGTGVALDLARRTVLRDNQDGVFLGAVAAC